MMLLGGSGFDNLGTYHNAKQWLGFSAGKRETNCGNKVKWKHWGAMVIGLLLTWETYVRIQATVISIQDTLYNLELVLDSMFIVIRQAQHLHCSNKNASIRKTWIVV